MIASSTAIARVLNGHPAIVLVPVKRVQGRVAPSGFQRRGRHGVQVAPGVRAVAEVEIQSVRQTTLAELTDQEATLTGAADRTELLGFQETFGTADVWAITVVPPVGHRRDA